MGVAVILVMCPRTFVLLFVSLLPEASHEIWFQMTQQFLRKKYLEIFDHGQRMTLTFDTHAASFTHLFDASTIFEIIGCNSFWKKK